jgi:hypothetical protein
MAKVDMSKWSAEQVKAYEAATAALKSEEDATAQEAARIKAEETSPEALIAAAREQAEELKAERERAARERADDRAYAAAVKAEGGDHRVARVRTHEGSVLLRPMTAAAWEEFCERLEELKEESDKRRISRETVISTRIHPDRTRFDYLVERFPFLWTHLYMARDALIDGVKQEARGKG